ncbi:restriction endonuclease subunit S [Collinsella intestinalis]|uniref:restriction endonuclease subunit S n=1 Tax=Collinsella intestinalis TaxID=147207 RepID=UPI001958D054|nr:restriction endonuclease subunit S [Collinsella intestinalis]MBM6941988.1 restriction endonuclease subunit S [Collinsella intestinalis]
MRTKLGDVCASIYDGDHNAPPKSGSGIPFITISNIDANDGFIDFSDTAFVPEEYYKSLKGERKPKRGDVLYSVVGSFGIPSLLKDDKRFVFQRHIAILRPSEKLDSTYLYYLLKDSSFYHWADAVAIGSAQRTVTLGQLRSKEVNLPDLETQRRIAAVLSAYDELIENSRKQIKLLEEAAQRLYKEWLIDLKFPGHETTPIVDGLPEGWRKVKLVDIADVQYGFAFKADQFNSDGNGLPIIRIRNVADGFSQDYTTEKTDEKYLVYDGDTIVGMDGDFYINSWSGGVAYLVQRSCRIKARDDRLDAYLRWAITAPIRAFQHGIVGSTVSHLGKRHIDSIEVLIPSYGMVDLFSSMRNQIVNLRKQIAAAREARNRLLLKLMSGEIKV